MDDIKVYAHGSYIGTTGYNNHTRDFFRELSKHCQIKFRNFTVAKYWQGYSLEPHEREEYLNDLDRKLLSKQTVWVGEGKREDWDIYPKYKNEFNHDLNIVLSETNHHYFYDHYQGPKIAYNVWESTLQPNDFFKKLLEYDELWVPSEWQKECSIKQGFNPEKIQVVPEGVDTETFFPEKVDMLNEYKDGRFKFLLFGRWDYRKSTKEIIETFLKTFDPNEPVDLIVSIDNMWGEEMDGYKNTQERLQAYNLLDDRIKILSFPTREDYIKFIKTGHVFVSCARSEGWNLPLIESMACGTPSIYSNCSGQLEFANGKGLPVNIIGEKSANENDYGRYKMSDLEGNYYEPDFDHLSRVMREVYENYDKYKTKSLIESEQIKKNFNWEKISLDAYEKLKNFTDKTSFKDYKSNSMLNNNKIEVSFLNGPKVEILGDFKKDYFVEFLDENDNVIHSSTIQNNMWTKCGRKYYTKWKIKVNGEVIDELDLTNKRVLISFHSSSMGDTIAWVPYAVEFAKKHKCKVILSTFHNDWFEGLENYKEIEFIKPGDSTNCHAVYNIGWFKDEEGRWEKLDYYPTPVNLVPLQQTATDILGLKYNEINYGINFVPKTRPISQQYIVFGPQATSGCKEWVYEHWVELASTLTKMGYKVVILSQKPYYIENTLNIINRDLNTVMNYLYHAKFFIGLGSGLSWLNWSLKKHTYMINGFSVEGHEFTENITKITKNVCIKCWNDEVHIFDAGDWDWCPVYKGTKLQHVCQKSIKPIDVLKSLKF